MKACLNYLLKKDVAYHFPRRTIRYENQNYVKNQDFLKLFKYQKNNTNKIVLELHCTPREQILFESYSNYRSYGNL